MFHRQHGKHLSSEDKGAIVALHNSGTPLNEIADTVGCHRETVQRWIRRYEEVGDVKRRVGSGRPRKTTQREDMRLLASIRAKPITTLQEIKGKKLT